MRLAAANTIAQKDLHRGLVHKFSWVALSGFGRQFALFAVNNWLAYCLSKELFGTLTCAFGALLVFIGVADFGLRQVGWREVARNPERIPDVVNSVLAARLMMTFVALAGFLATAVFFCHSTQDWIIFLAYSCGLFFNMSSFDFPFLGRDRMDTLGRCYAIAYAYYVPACLLTVRSDATAWLVPVHFAIAHALLFALLLREYRRSFGPLKLSFEPVQLSHYVNESWSLGINALLFRVVINYPVLLLGLAVSTAAAADYRLADMCYALFASLGLYLGSSTFTTYAAYDGANDQRIAHSVTTAVKTILLAMMPVGFLFITALPAFFNFAFHGRSLHLGLTCLLLGLTLPIAVTTRYLQTCLPSVGLNKELLKVNLVALGLGMGCGAALIPWGGSSGVAFSVLLAEATTLGLLLISVKRKLPVMQLGPMFGGPAIAAAVWLCTYFVMRSVGAPIWMQVGIPVVISTPTTWWLSDLRRPLGKISIDANSAPTPTSENDLDEIFYPNAA